MTEFAHTSEPGAAKIRLAEQRDHEAIRELFVQGMVDGQVAGNDTGADVENLREAYFADDGMSCFWIAELDDQVVGMIGVQNTKANAAEIRRLRVRNGYRRRGIGTALLRHAIDFCRMHAYLKVVLDVRIERGPAISMFEKFGFSLARTREIDGRKTLDFFIDLYREPPRM